MKKKKLDWQHPAPMTDGQNEIIREIIRSMIDRVKSDNSEYGGEGALLSEDKKEVIGRLWHLNLSDLDESTFYFCEQLYKSFVPNPEQIFRIQLQCLDVDHLDYSKTDVFKIILNPNYNLFPAFLMLEYYKQAGKECLNICGRDVDWQ